MTGLRGIVAGTAQATLMAADGATTSPPLDPPVTPGQHYFTLDELRAEQDIPEATYPDSAVEPNRDLAEQVIEHVTGIAFIPRRRTELVRPLASGHVRLGAWPVRDIEAVTVDHEDWTVEQVTGLTVDGQYLYSVPAQALVTYTHGLDVPPLRIRRAAMIATRVWTVRGPIDDRATQIAADGATINLATPGLFGSLTGIPEVDASISLYYRPVFLH